MSTKDTTPSPPPTLEALEAEEREAYWALLAKLGQLAHKALHEKGEARILFEGWAAAYYEAEAAKVVDGQRP